MAKGTIRNMGRAGRILSEGRRRRAAEAREYAVRHLTKAGRVARFPIEARDRFELGATAGAEAQHRADLNPGTTYVVVHVSAPETPINHFRAERS